MRRILILSPLLAMLALSACNTVAGAGKDISDTGKAITDTSEEVKADM